MGQARGIASPGPARHTKFRGARRVRDSARPKADKPRAGSGPGASRLAENAQIVGTPALDGGWLARCSPRLSRKEPSLCPVLTVLPSNKTLEVAPGTSLLAGLRRLGDLLKTRCDDQCVGECHVFVTEGKKTLSKADRSENGLLDTIVGVGSKSRLACQARVGEQDVTVELLGFASG